RDRPQQYLRLTGAAGSAEAGVGRLQSGLQRGLEDGVAGCQRDLVLTAAQADRDRRRGEVVGDLGLLVAVEEFHVDAVRLGAALEEQVAQVGRPLDRSTQEPRV